MKKIRKSVALLSVLQVFLLIAIVIVASYSQAIRLQTITIEDYYRRFSDKQHTNADINFIIDESSHITIAAVENLFEKVQKEYAKEAETFYAPTQLGISIYPEISQNTFASPLTGLMKKHLTLSKGEFPKSDDEILVYGKDAQETEKMFPLGEKVVANLESNVASNFTVVGYYTLDESFALMSSFDPETKIVNAITEHVEHFLLLPENKYAEIMKQSEYTAAPSILVKSKTDAPIDFEKLNRFVLNNLEDVNKEDALSYFSIYGVNPEKVKTLEQMNEQMESARSQGVIISAILGFTLLGITIVKHYQLAPKRMIEWIDGKSKKQQIITVISFFSIALTIAFIFAYISMKLFGDQVIVQTTTQFEHSFRNLMAQDREFLVSRNVLAGYRFSYLFSKIYATIAFATIGIIIFDCALLLSMNHEKKVRVASIQKEAEQYARDE